MSQAQPFNLTPPPPARPPAATASRAHVRRERLEAIYLQSGHRIGTVALFALAAAVAFLIKGVGPYGLLLAAAAVAADLGIVGSVLAWWTQRRTGRPTRESLGLVIFNAALLACSVTLYTLAKTNHLQPFITWLLSLFPPTNGG